MGINFKIVTPVYNAEAWIKKCIGSVKEQSQDNYQHIIVDDCSTDNTAQIAYDEILGDSRFKLVRKEKRMGVMHSHVTGTELLGKDADPEDVFIHLDGDDWLAHADVLKTVQEVYEREDCWMTYGDYTATDGSRSVNNPRIEGLPLRQHILAGWPFSHLRTFKKFLWDNIKVESLLDQSGVPFTSACDVAILSPMLEMAEDHIYRIKEPLLIYNRDNPLNEDKDHLDDQIRCAHEIFKQKAYSRLKR